MRLGPLAALVAAGLTAAACGTADGGSSDATITVFAAASLTDSFTAIGDAFEADHPGTTVTFNFGASSQLAVQITEGAPASVFAAADESTMAQVLAALPDTGPPIVFAHNSAAIAVEPGNPASIESLADLADPDLIVVVCAPEAPCGHYADALFNRNNVEVQPSSFEANVKAVVAKVALGEADAGIVYTSDIAATAQVEGVAIAPEQNIDATYPIVVIDSGDSTATKFVAFVTSPAGQQILRDHGFESGIEPELGADTQAATS